MKDGDIEKRFFGSAGGKARIAKKLVEMLPPHRVYVEPFAGSAAVFFAKEPVEVEVLNDTDSDIMRVYRLIQSLDDAAIEKLRGMDWKGDKSTYDRLVKSEPEDELEWLYRTLYVLRFSYGNKYKSGFGSSDGGHVAGMPDRVAKHRGRLKGTKLYNVDYREVVKEHDAEDALFFFDPPYAGHNVAIGERDFDESAFFDVLKGLRGKFLLTYGVRGRLPRMLRKQEGFFVKRLVTYRAARTWRGADFDTLQLQQLLVTNYNVDVAKAVGDEYEVEKPYQTEHAARQFGPHEDADFRRFHPEGWPAGIDAILEIRGGKSRVQSVRAKKDRWSLVDFKRWLRTHDMKSDRVEAAELEKAVENATDAERADLSAAAYAAPFYVDAEGHYDPTRKGEFLSSKSAFPHHVKTVQDPDDDETVDLERLRNAFSRWGQEDWTKFGASASSVRRVAREHLEGHARRLLSSQSESAGDTTRKAANGATAGAVAATLRKVLDEIDVVGAVRELVPESAKDEVIVRVLGLLLGNASVQLAKGVVGAAEPFDVAVTGGPERIAVAGVLAQALEAQLPAEAIVLRAALQDVHAVAKALVELREPVDALELADPFNGLPTSPKLDAGLTVLKSAVEGKYVLAIVLEPNDEAAGLDPDAQGDIYSEEEVRKAFEYYAVNSYGTLRLMHKGFPLSRHQMVVLDNFTAPVAFEVDRKPVKKGAWLMGIGVLDGEIQKDIRSGVLNGLSVAGGGVRTKAT